eukprot:4032855-Pyramimonas_sp.AAC.1
MCWKDRYIDLLLSYPPIPHSEPPQQRNGRYLPSASHGSGCDLSYQAHFRLTAWPSGDLDPLLETRLSSRVVIRQPRGPKNGGPNPSLRNLTKTTRRALEV